MNGFEDDILQLTDSVDFDQILWRYSYSRPWHLGCNLTPCMFGTSNSFVNTHTLTTPHWSMCEDFRCMFESILPYPVDYYIYMRLALVSRSTILFSGVTEMCVPLVIALLYCVYIYRHRPFLKIDFIVTTV